MRKLAFALIFTLGVVGLASESRGGAIDIKYTLTADSYSPRAPLQPDLDFTMGMMKIRFNATEGSMTILHGPVHLLSFMLTWGPDGTIAPMTPFGKGYFGTAMVTVAPSVLGSLMSNGKLTLGPLSNVMVVGMLTCTGGGIPGCTVGSMGMTMTITFETFTNVSLFPPTIGTFGAATEMGTQGAMTMTPTIMGTVPGLTPPGANFTGMETMRTHTPEPGSFSLVGLGLLLLGAAGARRARKRR